MDKIAANNHIVSLKKEIKKAKAMVCGNLIRKIAKLKEEKEKLDEDAQKLKLDDRIQRILDEVKLVKALDSYPVAKAATLHPNPEFWDKLISDTKSSDEERAKARVIIKNAVQKQVNKFRSDYQSCDEWLNEYFEYREKKHDLMKLDQPKRPGKFGKKANAQKKERPIDNKDCDQAKKPARRDSKLDDRRGSKFDTKREHQSSRKQTHKMSKDVRKREHRPQEKVVAEDEEIHPSWKAKKAEKEFLKAALSGRVPNPSRITFGD